MNIKDFLIDNYIWIIVVILLVIITVIGFLADKKKNREPKNSGTAPVPNNPPTTNGEVPAAPMNYQPTQNEVVAVAPNTNIVEPIPAQVPNNQAVAVADVAPNNIMSSNQSVTPVAPVTVEPINNVNAVKPEPMYQPLAEQKPSFAPAQNNIVNVEPMLNQPVLNSQVAPVTPNANPKQQPLNPMPSQFSGNVNTNPAPIPTPSVQAPIPEPIPNPMVNNQNVVTGNNNGVPSQTTMPQSVNFVYGAQQINQNNNGQM